MNDCMSVPHIHSLPQKAEWRFELAVPANGLKCFLRNFASLQPMLKVQGFRSESTSSLKNIVQLPWDNEAAVYDVVLLNRNGMFVMGSIDGNVFKHVTPY